MIIRPAAQGDPARLRAFLAMAASEPDAAAAREDRFVATRPVGWQHPSDFGFLAEIDGAAAGAAWARHIPAEDNP